MNRAVLWLSVVIDEACGQIWDALGSGVTVTSLRVSPDVYRAVAAARPGEVAHGYPLMLLGLPLVADSAVTSYGPVAVRSAGAGSDGAGPNGTHGHRPDQGSNGKVR